MKKLILYICTFVLVFFIVDSEKIGSRNENYNICLTENNASADDMLTIQDIIKDRHKSESKEKIKKNGCVIQCMLQKLGGIDEESKFKANKLAEEFSKRTNAQSEDKIFETLENCINETKDLTLEKCEKSFAFVECFVKAKAHLFAKQKQHTHEHEHEHEKEPGK